ncbi:hypothetical protein CVT24_010633 [Panaeolus cyanescens]|uniref:PEBP-like protein n=1 Tax=Panaeolus cyanescens TaxID=181874 RepID=A0A409YLZ9_9AGAR|nr:hypothetical protein CVT24_010633 [Panaeolus cyanescens]
MRSITIPFVLFFGLALAQSDDPFSDVTSAFNTAQIVPDVISTFSPTELVNVSFTDPTTQDMLNVDTGMMLTPDRTDSFVVALVDPDAPTPQTAMMGSQFLQFLGGDFMADPVTGILLNNSAALMEYTPPTPPSGSDPHRYIVLVYNQSTNFDTDAPSMFSSSTSQSSFDISTFAQSLGLGDPVAGNFFIVGSSNATNSATPSPPIATNPGTDTNLPGGLPTDLPTLAPTDSSFPLPTDSGTTPTVPAGGSSSATSVPSGGVLTAQTNHRLVVLGALVVICLNFL